MKMNHPKQCRHRKVRCDYLPLCHNLIFDIMRIKYNFGEKKTPVNRGSVDRGIIVII